MKFMYEALTEKSTESPKREIMAIERSSGADPCHRESLEPSLGKINEEDLLSQMKDLDDATESDVETCTRALRGHYYVECAEAKKIASKSCGQVKVVAAKLVKENSPDVSSVP